MLDKLDLDGFERYCKNINFTKSISSYKSYLKNGLQVLNLISKDGLEEFYKKIEQNNKSVIPHKFPEYPKGTKNAS